MKYPSLVIALFLGAVITAHAQVVTFEVTATAGGTAHGYTNGQAYTFIFTTPGNYASNPDSSFVWYKQAYYDDDTGTDANLFTSITGSGVTGSFVRPSGPAYAPYSYIVATDPHALDIVARSDNHADLGLRTPDSTPLGWLEVNMSASALPAFSFPAAYQSPFDYFSPIAGIYSPGPGDLGVMELFDPSGAHVLDFTVNSFTLSTSAIPEPATTAGLLGLAGLGAVFFVRRRVAV